MATTARSIALYGDFAYPYPSPGFTVEGQDGRPYPKYPPTWSLLQVPAQYVEWIISTSSMEPGEKELFTRLIRGVTPAAIGALSVVFLFAALTLLPVGTSLATTVAIAFHLATCALPYMRSLYSEVLQSTCVNASILCLIAFHRGPTLRHAFFLGLAAGAVLASKVPLAPFALALLLGGVLLSFRSDKGPKRCVAALLLGFAPPLSLILWHNYVRFGFPFEWHYGYFPVGLSLHGPIWVGLYGLLLSSGRGLLFYAPLVLLAIPGLVRLLREKTVVTLVLLSGFIAMLLVYAAYTVWHGCEQWGPRFLVPLLGVPAIGAAFTVERSKRRLRLSILPLLIALGLVVNVPGLLIHYMDFYDLVPYRPYSEVEIGLDGKPASPVEEDNLFLTNFVPHFSPIVGHLWLLKHVVTGEDVATDCPWRGLIVDRPFLRHEGPPPPVDLWFVAGPQWEGRWPWWKAGVIGLVFVVTLFGAWYEALRSVGEGQKVKVP